MIRLLLVICILLVRCAHAQFQHGTIGVISFSKEKIVMAADSRGLISDASNQDTQNVPSDQWCKVAAPCSETLFVGSNILGYGGDSNNPGWTAIDDAHAACMKVIGIYGTTRDHVSLVADEWGSRMATHLQNLHNSHPELTRARTVLVKAFFGGRATTGDLVLFKSSVTFDPSITPIMHTVESEQEEPCPTCYWALGRTEVVLEFVGATSPRARNERFSAWKPSDTFAPADYDILRAERLVDLTIAYHTGLDDVGGPIDSVQLTKDGSVRWGHRKPNCPAN